MALNDILRLVADSSGVTVQIRNAPGVVAPVVTLGPGYMIVGGKPADPNSVEAGGMYYDAATGKLRIKAALVETF